MIIGSTAMKHHFPDFKREPVDIDVIALGPNAQSPDGRRIDGFWHDSFPPEWAEPEFATPDFLYTLKASHAHWDLHGTWEKHMADLLFLQAKGAKLDREAYDILVKVWKEKHGVSKANLNQTKEDFFDDAVVRKYDHDSLHDSVAYGDVPMYTRILKDGSEVLVDNSKFWAMSHEDKIKTIREEVYATALERWVIPSNYRVSPRAAYARALKKSITSLFKGEWVLFIVENYTELFRPDMDYVQHHLSKQDKLILL